MDDPVAFIDVTHRTLEWARPTRWETPTVVNMPFVPLYTAPPKKEWVGLTNKEILADDVLRYHFALNGGAGPISKKGLAVIAAVNAKLKEKNNG